MVKLDWLVVAPAMKEEWKCTTIDGGRLYAMIHGISMTLMLCADNLDTEEQLQHKCSLWTGNWFYSTG